MFLDPNNDIQLDDGVYRFIDRIGNLLRFKDQCSGDVITIHIHDLPSRMVGASALPTTPSPIALDTLSPEDRKEVQTWAADLREMEDGTRPGHTDPRPEYDPALTTLNDRIKSKIAELEVRQIKASRSSLLRKRALLNSGGPAALIDGRKLREHKPLKFAAQEVLDILSRVMNDQTGESTINRAELFRRVREELIRRGCTSEISDASLYRYFNVLDAGRHTAGKATSRQSKANVPSNRILTTSLRLVPGEEVQVDSTPLDMLVTVREGVTLRPTLSIMFDVATRSILGYSLRFDATKGYDHALLLAQAIVPISKRPDRSRQRAMVKARYPEQAFLSDEQRALLEGRRPYIYPRRIVTDNGKDYISDVFRSATAKFGIHVTQSAIHTPTDKSHVERMLGTINSLFVSRLPGYIGSSTVNRGYKIHERKNLLDLAALSELLDDWIINVWQNRKHTELRDVFNPSELLTPNQAFNASSEWAGIPMIRLSEADYIDLLPVAYRTIQATGITFSNREYDSEELHAHRRRPSNFPRKDGKWEVRYNPYDAFHVWVKGVDGEWIECPWRQAAALERPFAAEITRSLSVHERADAAQEQAALTTPMPKGSGNAPAAEADLWDWADVSGTELTNFNTEDEEDADAA